MVSASIKNKRALSKHCAVGNKGVLVFDNLLSKRQVNDIARLYSKRTFTKGSEPQEPLQSALSEESAKGLPFMKSLVHLLNRHCKKIDANMTNHELFAGYLARFRYGDVAFVHSDNPCKNCLSVIYYANPSWDSSWGGETIFFDETRDATVCVLPKPGRIVAFNGCILHRAGIPTRNAPHDRLTAALFFRCRESFAQSFGAIT